MELKHNESKTGNAHWDNMLDKFNLSDDALETIKMLRNNDIQTHMASIARFSDGTKKIENLKSALKDIIG